MEFQRIGAHSARIMTTSSALSPEPEADLGLRVGARIGGIGGGVNGRPLPVLGQTSGLLAAELAFAPEGEEAGGDDDRGADQGPEIGQVAEDEEPQRDGPE